MKIRYGSFDESLPDNRWPRRIFWVRRPHYVEEVKGGLGADVALVVRTELHDAGERHGFHFAIAAQSFAAANGVSDWVRTRELNAREQTRLGHYTIKDLLVERNNETKRDISDILN